MTRIGYWGAYYMPVLLASSPYAPAAALVGAAGAIAAAAAGAGLLGPDAGPFEPNAQDYFRTALLGFLPPVLVHCIKTFVLGTDGSATLAELVVDYPLSDALMAALLAALAYPQAHQTASADNGWQLTPRQSYVFGLSWALNELLLAVLGSLNEYAEEPRGLIIHAPDAQSEELSSVRRSISLSRCMNVRRQASRISDNIYQPPPRAPHSYGSLVPPRADDDLVVLAFTGDSPDADTLLPNRAHRAHAYSSAPFYFAPAPSWPSFCRRLLLANLIVLAHLLQAAGQALLMSLYFLYVPGRDAHLARPVVYFGAHSFVFFAAVLLLPFSLANFACHVLLLSWKDDRAVLLARSASHEPDSLLPSPASDSPAGACPPSPFRGHLPPRLCRGTLQSWRALASRRGASPVGALCWALAVFVVGVWATRPPT
ncbi:AaceriAFR161Cp [[Ashbya] aceris (nom. inval.)]|nr:AaceriAFR161Cp [[Ashbya] aceris (nom. inval.)]